CTVWRPMKPEPPKTTTRLPRSHRDAMCRLRCTFRERSNSAGCESCEARHRRSLWAGRGPGPGLLRSGATAIYHQLPPAYVPTMRLEVGRSVAQPGSALASGARGREFESPRSDQQNQQLSNVETLGRPRLRPKLGRGASSGTWKAERAH